MSQFDAQDWITRLFLRLKQRGYSLGLDEYQAALKAVEAGYAQNEEALIEMVQILWCHSRSQQNQLVPIWQDLQRQVKKQQETKDDFKDRLDHESGDAERSREENQEREKKSESVTTEVEVQPNQEVATLPVQAPSFTPVEQDGLLSLQSYFPVSRRAMVYGWRFLQRSVADGCRTVLDIPATVQHVTEQGYYLAPVYQRQKRNAARLLLLIDQNGSMMPFHRFTRDLVETAREESLLEEENVQVFYFHNVPATYVYQDVYLTKPIAMKDVLGQCDADTSVLIVGDAGAARGYRRQERIQETTRFLLQVRKRSSLIAWLNPMSRKRWVGSSAEILAYLVPMFQMDRFGFAEAIDVLRGLVTASEEERE
jgi:hypothetical protein